MTDSQTGVKGAGAGGTPLVHSRNNEHDSNREQSNFHAKLVAKHLWAIFVCKSESQIGSGHLRDIACAVATVITTVAPTTTTTRGITPITITGIELAALRYRYPV